MPRTYHVYIMASLGGVLCIGITGNLQRRVQEHKHDLLAGFTRRYRAHRLAYAEGTPDVHDAITREKQLKGWTRRRKGTSEQVHPGLVRGRRVRRRACPGPNPGSGLGYAASSTCVLVARQAIHGLGKV